MLKYSLYLFFILSMVRCASVSTLQTARVLDKDDSFHSVGLSFYSSDDFLGGDDISIPLLEYTYRRGVWDKIDMGLKLAIIGTAVVDAKYNLINSENWALATGLGLGYLSFESTVGGTTETSTILDFFVPVYLSYDFSKTMTVYSAAKYMLRTISGDGISGDGSLLSSTLGLKLGDQSGIFFEGTLISGLDSDFTGQQLSGSYFFRF